MRKLYPGGAGYSLATLCQRFDVPLETHHRALCDAEAAAELAYDLLTYTAVPADMTQGKTVPNGKIDVAVELEEGHRNADPVVEVSLGRQNRVSRRLQRRSGELLRGRLADRAGDPDHHRARLREPDRPHRGLGRRSEPGHGGRQHLLGCALL